MAEEKKVEEPKTTPEEEKKLARLEQLIVALMDAELDEKTIVFNFSKTELEYANRKWIVYEEG